MQIGMVGLGYCLMIGGAGAAVARLEPIFSALAPGPSAAPRTSGRERRGGIHAEVDEGVPAPVLTAALYQRFASRGAGDFAGKVLSAMRQAFGGHEEQKP